MKNLKISKKLFIAFFVVLLLLVVCIGTGILNLQNVKSGFGKFYSGPFTVKGAANTTNTNFEAMQKSVFRAISTDHQTVTTEAIQNAKNAAASIQEQLPILKANFQGDQQIITNLEQYLSELAPHREKVLELASNNQNKEAAEYMETYNIPIIKKIQTELQSLISFANENGDNLKKEIDTTQMHSVIILSIMGIASILISIFFGTYITRGIAKPIAEIERATQDLANGNLNINLEYDSKDELGILTNNMRSMINSLRSYIEDIGRAMSEMAKGNMDISSKADFKGDFITLRDNINAVVESFNSTLTQINQSADQVASGSEQVSSGSQALSQGATEQASSVEELAATINEIADQVKSNAENANEASSLAGNVGDEMAQSNQQMQKMIHAMDEITQSSQEIGKIIKTIEDIAFQTNILALNAAVEAARAGSAGKGFAVVADEVRNLASKSAEASKNTAALIENSISSVQQGTKIVDETAKSLVSAVEGAQKVKVTIDKISEASNNQSTSLTQVTQGMDQISSVVQTNSATAEESAAASEELSGQAQILKGLVNKFHLKDTSDFSAPVIEPKTSTNDYNYSVDFSNDMKY